MRSLAPPLVLVALTGSLLLAGCASSGSPGTAPSDSSPLDTEMPADLKAPAEAAPADTVITGVGSVQYVALEGGFYGIVNRDTDRRYIPDSLAAPYRIDGLAVQYQLRLKRGQPSFRMWGIPATVLSIETVAQSAR